MSTQMPLPNHGLWRGRPRAPLSVAGLLLLATASGCEGCAGIETVTRATGGSTGTGGQGGGPVCEGGPPQAPARCDSPFNGEDAVSLGAGLPMDACVVAGSLVDAGVAWGVGGLLFSDEDPNTLLVVGAAETADAALYSVPVLRDEECHLAGLGAAKKIANTPYADGLTRGPDGALFFGLGQFQQPIIAGVGRMKPASEGLDEVVDLTPFGLDLAVTGVGIVPNGFPGAGTFVLLTYSLDVANDPGRWYSVELTHGLDGPLAVTAVTPRADLAAPASIVFLPANNGVYSTQKALVADHAAYAVMAYDLDAAGVPKTALGEPLFTNSMAGLGELGRVRPWGMALDPVGGDLLVDVVGDSEQLLALRGFSP